MSQNRVSNTITHVTLNIINGVAIPMKICKPSHFTVSDLVAGVDVILDIIGAPYLTRNLEALGMDGRLYILGMQSGPRGDVDITAIIKKRITIACTSRLNCTFFFIFLGGANNNSKRLC